MDRRWWLKKQADGNTDRPAEDEGIGPRFALRLLFIHPTLDLGFMPELLGLGRRGYMVVGAPRRTPKGTSLSGVYPDSRWSVLLERHQERLFSLELERLVQLLEQHQRAIGEIVLSGGEAQLIVNFAGNANIGDTLSWELLERLVKLKVSLGLEVFPDF